MNTRAARRACAAAVFAVVGLTACDDDSPTAPLSSGDAMFSASTLAYGTVDLTFGDSYPMTVTLSNTGSGSLAISNIVLAGADLGAFAIVDGSDISTLAAGSSLDITVTFNPSSEGAKSAFLRVVSDDPDQSTLDVSLFGTGAAHRYTQVDRIGIPALNTVFNHPPVFSKTDYNKAGPENDVAAYTGLFVTVMGAVANADPAGTAAVLLPDELPVSLAAGPSNFAVLNGRKLEDDATDVALSVVIGIASLHSDNVDANDVPFSTTFPYLAPPHS